MKRPRQELGPSPDLSPPSTGQLSAAQRIELWAELVDEADALLVAGIEAEVADVVALLRENATTLDNAYLASWIARLDLRDDFETVWREAFPGRAQPL